MWPIYSCHGLGGASAVVPQCVLSVLVKLKSWRDKLGENHFLFPLHCYINWVGCCAQPILSLKFTYVVLVVLSLPAYLQLRMAPRGFQCAPSSSRCVIKRLACFSRPSVVLLEWMALNDVTFMATLGEISALCIKPWCLNKAEHLKYRH